MSYYYLDMIFKFYKRILLYFRYKSIKFNMHPDFFDYIIFGFGIICMAVFGFSSNYSIFYIISLFLIIIILPYMFFMLVNRAFSDVRSFIRDVFGGKDK